MANNVSVRLFAADNTTSIDVTSYVLSVSTEDGKSRALDYYEPGTCAITFNNYDRIFDPTNAISPLYDYLRPNKRVLVYFGTDETLGIIFSGLIFDWSFEYNVSGEATAILNATQKSTLFANQYLDAQTFPSEKSGARINRILDDANVEWPSSYGSRVIDAGTQTLDADTVAANTNVFDYLRQIETSEQGQLYMTGADAIVFDDNSVGISTIGGFPTFTDDGTGYAYESIDVSYTSELLYNVVKPTAWDGSSPVYTISTASISDYGRFQLNVDNVLYNDAIKLNNLALYIIKKYSEPEYRINTVTQNLYPLTLAQQITLRNVTTLNTFAKVIFKPNGVGLAISKYVRIIGINHDITPDSHLVTYKLESLKNLNLVLDDNEFGKLNTYSLGL